MRNPSERIYHITNRAIYLNCTGQPGLLRVIYPGFNDDGAPLRMLALKNNPAGRRLLKKFKDRVNNFSQKYRVVYRCPFNRTYRSCGISDGSVPKYYATVMSVIQKPQTWRQDLSGY